MPSSTERQRRFMGAEYARARAGEKTRTGMPMKKLREFARKPKMPMSHMPKGATQSPSGDLGEKRQKENARVGGFTDGAVVCASRHL